MISRLRYLGRRIARAVHRWLNPPPTTRSCTQMMLQRPRPIARPLSEPFARWFEDRL